MSASDTTRVEVRNDKQGRGERSLSPQAPPMSVVLSRREALVGVSALALVACAPDAALQASPDFDPPPGPDDAFAPGYVGQLVIGWGDALWPDLPELSPQQMSAEAAAQRFGVNNDFLAWYPLPARDGADESGLLVVNHEYPSPHMMFDGVRADAVPAALSDDQVAATLSSVGMSVVQLRRDGSAWSVVSGAPLTRRVTASTPIRISGPAAGDARMKTSADPDGRLVLGTHDNCNGGMTPWGTFLSGEEGSSDFFGGDIAGLPDEALLERYHYRDLTPQGEFGWARVDRRFDVRTEPNEPNRFEWVVELDPFDPGAPPVKRTALGRFAHEGAHCALCPDGRVAVYLGDDWEFEYCYRFVTSGRYNPDDRAANRDLLDDGVLSVARFNDDGAVDWLPLVHGQGPLTPENGFVDQADVLIRTRMAADALGATPMDSPEGYGPNPKTGRVYIVLTGNEDRKPGQEDAANPRADNRFGHILEMTPPDIGGGPDHGAARYDWRVLVLCGGRGAAPQDQGLHADTPPAGRFVAPDNIAFDRDGRMWLCSDGPGERGEDGLWVMALEGEEAMLPKLVYRPPIGAECCGPAFTPSGDTIFVSIQHPGEITEALAEAPTHWPAKDASSATRPAVIAITRTSL
jgi:secreted PhoX family phosphatase